MKSNDELKQIAIDLVENKIFCHLFIPPSEFDIIRSIFLPIGLGLFSDKTKEELENIGLIYEHISNAENRSINGYPIFMSVKLLIKSEMEIVHFFCQEYEKMKNSFMAVHS